MAEAQADRLGQRQLAVLAALPERQPEAVARSRRRARRRRRVARGAGADADVAPPARGEQVVVEGGDAVDGRLGQAGALGRDAAIVVGDLTAGVHRLLQHVERGRRALRVMAPDQLDEVAGHRWMVDGPVEPVKVMLTTNDRSSSMIRCMFLRQLEYLAALDRGEPLRPCGGGVSRHPADAVGRAAEPRARARRAARSPRARVRGLHAGGRAHPRCGRSGRSTTSPGSTRRPAGCAAGWRARCASARSRPRCPPRRTSPSASATAIRACACGCSR